MKIIFFSNSCWSIFNFRLSLIKTLLKKKYKIIILAPFDGYEKKLNKLGCRIINININNNKINIISDLLLIKDIYKILAPNRINSILLNFTIKPLIFGSFVSNILKIPSICMMTGLGTVFIKDSFLKKIVLIMYKISFYKIYHVFFQNIDDRDIFLKKKIISTSNSSLIPGSGVSLNKFKFQKLKKKKIISFLLVARILKEKGILEYLKAAEEVKKRGYKIKFNLLGSFDHKNQSTVPEEIIKKAEKDKIIKYLGFVSDVRYQLRQSDCVVLPSYREGTPRSLLEAASIGRPIITTNAPGCKEVLVNGKNGFFCKIRDYKSLYSKIIKFYKLSFLKKNKMSKYSHKIATKIFDENIVIKKYINLIEKINVK